MTVRINGRDFPQSPTPKRDTLEQVAYDQACSLIALACEQDEPTYIAQLQAIDRPHLVLNALVEMLVKAVPYDKHEALARQLRATMGEHA